MTTVKQLIEALQKLPEDTIVKVLDGNSWVDIDIRYFENGDLCCDGIDYCDFSQNKFVKEDDPRKQQKFLFIGAE